MKDFNEITVSKWLQDEFEESRRRASAENIQRLKKEKKQREYIRNICAAIGFLLVFCGVGSMECTPINIGGVATMGIGLAITMVPVLTQRPEE